MFVSLHEHGVVLLRWVTSALPHPPVLLVFGMDHRAKNGSWDLILPTIKSPELLSNCRYSVYCVLWTTANIYAFIQHTHGLTLLQANTHTRTKTHTSAETGTERGKQPVQNLTNKELLNRMEFKNIIKWRAKANCSLLCNFFKILPTNELNWSHFSLIAHLVRSSRGHG